jgi:4-oxalocrotonate tautomerase
MPLARIDLIVGKPEEYRQTVGDVVYQAMVNILKAPKDDRFQVINEHPAPNFIFDPHFFGIERSADCIFIQLTLASGRTLEQKRGFYKQVADELHRRLGVRHEDVFINLVPVDREDWSFGNGEASLVKDKPLF